MSIISTPTASVASTDNGVALPPSTSATDAATSTTISSPSFDSTGSTSLQATLTSSDTFLTPPATSTSFTPDPSSSEIGFTSPPPFSSVTVSTVTTSPYSETSSSVAEITSSSQTSVTSAATSLSTEITSQTSVSEVSTVDSSQTEVPSGSATSTPSDGVSLGMSTSSVGTTFTSPFTTTTSPETTPTSTSISPGPSSGTTSLKASSTNPVSTDRTSAQSRTTQGPSESSSASYHHGYGHTEDAGEDTTPTSPESDQKTSHSKIGSSITPLRGTQPSISFHIPNLGSIIRVPAIVQTSTSTATASPNAGGQTTGTNPKSPQEKPTRWPQLKDPIHFSDLLDPITKISTEIQALIPPSSSTSSAASNKSGTNATASDHYTRTNGSSNCHLLCNPSPIPYSFWIQESLILLLPLKPTVRVTQDPHPLPPFLALPLLPLPLARVSLMTDQLQDMALALHLTRLRTLPRFPTVTVQPRTRLLPQQATPFPLLRLWEEPMRLPRA
ncbi:hypothetical protein IW262DRAFT_123962 [Armillaria fumosa]|nr:hypothetical protein IW262DRAFT_123962 [Armillaria fumosa]